MFQKPAPPVIPGPDGAIVPGSVEAQCDACKRRSVAVHIEWPDSVAIWLCDDVDACSRRYRDGASPESYAAGLRGELLAVAP